MAADNDQTRQIELLDQQVEKLTREFAAMNSAFASVRRTRLLLTLAVFVFVLVVCYVFYRSGKELLSDAYRERVTVAAQKKMDQNKDLYMREVELFVKNSTPVVTEAFNQQLTKDMPKYAKLLGQEQDKFTKEMEKQLEPILKKHYEAALNRHKGLLHEEFPKATDSEIDSMMANVMVALDDVLKKNYIDELKRQMQQLFDTWHEFPAASAPSRGQPSLSEDLRTVTVELIISKLGNGENMPSSMAAPKKSSAAGDSKKPDAEGEKKKPAAEGDSKKPDAEGEKKKPAAEGDPKKPSNEGDPKK
jgi:hypothetical protein